MTTASWPAPTSRIWSGWWHDLASQQPLALWLAQPRVHRIEALVGVERTQSLDPLHRMVLRALEVHHPEAIPMSRLNHLLHLGHQAVCRLLVELTSLNLTQPETDDRWSITERGRQALADQRHPCPLQERRVFHFVESELPDQGLLFLPFTPPVGLTWPVEEPGGFHPDALRNCIRQAAAWKQSASFPDDVRELYDLNTEPTDSPESWQRVILDRPERWSLLLLRTRREQQEELRAFPLIEENWQLLLDQPVLSLGADWPQVVPELAQSPSEDAVRSAWQAWCQHRGLNQPEIEQCPLRLSPPRLRASLSAAMVEHLRATRGDVLEGKAWLLIGSGRIRQAAQIEVAETPK